MVPYTKPTSGSSAFNCPYCGAYANQNWYNLYCGLGNSLTISDSLHYCSCIHCTEYSIWRKDKMILPSIGTVIMPNSDLPQDIKIDYEEAREKLNKSSQGAAAILRLAIQ